MGYEREVEAGVVQQATEQAEDSPTQSALHASLASTGNARAIYFNNSTTTKAPKSSSIVSPTQHHQNHQHRSKINYPALGAVAFACFTMSIVLCLVAPTLAKRRRRRRHLQTAMQRAAVAANQEDASVRDGIRQQAPEKRYASIEAWLVAKTVLGHDDVCERVLATQTMTSSRSSGSLSTLGESASVTNRMTTNANHMSKSSGLEVSAGNNENNNKTSNYCECPICFDTIEPGDIVSWSPQPDCKHVFHHECIKEWLLKNHNCPCCRQICLPIDQAGTGTGTESNKKIITGLLLQRQHRDTPCFFCAEHGVVRPPRHLWQKLVTVSPQEQQEQETTAIVDRLRSDAGPTNDNDNTDEDDDRAIFRERLLARSFENCCRSTLQRLRGSTSTPSPTITLSSAALQEGQVQERGTAEDEEDLENQPVAVSVSVGSVGDSTATWSDAGTAPPAADDASERDHGAMLLLDEVP